MEKFILSNGIELPNIGFGTWKLKNNEETTEIIKNAIQSGYRLIDTASAYGNEEAIGVAIKEANINRDNLFISGKLWNADRGYENIINACKKTIENLQCEYLDLYLIHWPASKAVHENWKEINIETWRAFEYLYEQGLVRAIGVCNFKKHQLEDLIQNVKIKPMINQIEYHIGFTQMDTVNYCKDENIVVEAWSPIGSGKMLKVPELQEMALKYNVSVARLCIKYCMQHDILPIPKSKNKERMEENIDMNSFTIQEDDMKILDAMPYVGGSGLDSETITLFG